MNSGRSRTNEGGALSCDKYHMRMCILSWVVPNRDDFAVRNIDFEVHKVVAIAFYSMDRLVQLKRGVHQHVHPPYPPSATDEGFFNNKQPCAHYSLGTIAV